MKRIVVCWLVLGVMIAQTRAYQVYEEPEENDETNRGKRQQNGVAVIDSIFNIPITAIKQTSVAAQTLSPGNAATIDSVLKIPVSTLEAVGNLIKNRQQNRETTPLSASRPPRRLQRRYDTPTTTQQPNDAAQRRRDEIRKRVEAQRERQRLYEEQLHRRRFQQLQQYTRRMQQDIATEDTRTHHRFYRDPFGFNALTKWIVGPHGVFNGHAGHGDGHVYQFFNPEKPLHFGGQQQQGIHHPIPTKPTPIQGSTISTTTTTGSFSSSTSTSTTTSTTSRPGPIHNYEVHEIVDEGLNPFTWPNWFGIINALVGQQQQLPLQNKIAPNKKVRFDEPPIQNKIAPKDDDYYKYKYVQARKNLNVREEELTGNEIDGEVGSDEIRFVPSEREGRVLFPSRK